MPHLTAFARNQWYVAAYSHEVGRELLGRTILGEPLVFYRSEDDGTAVALADRCVHRRFPLSESRLDGDRIVLAGESAGGQLVSMAGARDNRRLRLRGVLGLSAAQDLLAMSEWLRGVGVVPPEIAAFVGVEKWNDATVRKLKSSSPRYEVRAGAAPFLLLHGSADTLVDRTQASDMCDALKKVGSSCEVVLVPGGEHRVATWPEHSEAESRAAEWLIGRTGLP